MLIELIKAYPDHIFTFLSFHISFLVSRLYTFLTHILKLLELGKTAELQLFDPRRGMWKKPILLFAKKFACTFPAIVSSGRRGSSLPPVRCCEGLNADDLNRKQCSMLEVQRDYIAH